MIRFLNNSNGFVESDSWTPYCWVNVECPDRDDVKFLLDDLHIPSDFLDSIADVDELPRVEHDGEWKLTILRIPLKTDGGSAPFVTVPIGIITNNEIIVTICYHRSELISDFIDFSRSKGIHIETEGEFILRILFSATYWFLRYLRDINRMADDSERQLQKSIRNEDLSMLQKLQRTLVYFNTSLKGNEVLIDRLCRVYDDRVPQDLLEDLRIEMSQATNTVMVYSDIINDMLDSFASIISNNVGDIMKKMTGVSIILMIPTLVASFYGMNVTITYGGYVWVFPVIVGGSLALSIVLYKVLKKVHWL